MSTIKQTLESAVTAVKHPISSILGTFTGKCLDTNVFNNNDWRASRPVFETLMESDEYKRAMEYGHYIGFAGHPADSDCQDFEHACIVMKDMRLNDDGTVEGDFDLIDTPVGRIVKAFIDAGVKFGISIRGLGDIGPDGEVDPDEFIFRGFDLVTFPAYDDCIPEFKEIAASTDAKKQAKYKKLCASIGANLENISSCEALSFIKDQLPEESDEYNKVQDRIDELTVEDGIELAEDAIGIADGVSDSLEAIADNLEDADIAEEKLAAMTELYLDCAEQVRELEAELAEEQANNQVLVLECKTLKQKQARLDRLVANQVEDASKAATDLQYKYERSTRQLEKVRASLSTARANLVNTKKELEDTRSELKASKVNCTRQIAANTKLKEKLDFLTNQRKEDLNSIKSSKDLNLKYEHKIEANSRAITQKDSAIEDLKAKLHETVVANSELESKASNLDEKNGELLSRVEAAENENKELLSRIAAAEDAVANYQQAYANLYANALGVYLTGLPITASTSVEELTDMIKAGTSTASMPSSPSYYSDDEGDEYIDAEDDVFDDANYSAEMVSM